MSPGGSVSTDTGEQGWKKSHEPTGMWMRSRGREPPGQEEVDREGGQEASRCASAGITAGLEYRPPWGSSLCREPSGQGPRARGRKSKEKVFL